MICHYCKADDKEMRPFGPGGAQVCFDCAFATPERQAETERQFDARLNSACEVSDIIELTEDGPRPMGVTKQ